MRVQELGETMGVSDGLGRGQKGARDVREILERKRLHGMTQKGARDDCGGRVCGQKGARDDSGGRAGGQKGSRNDSEEQVGGRRTHEMTGWGTGWRAEGRTG